ncbi:MAG: glycosyltransferase family 4 protein [Ruminococcaceae bacterium]|nr:glycosyltransferase family 4 protein [Oscillospiraceae bacterium]
MKITLIGNSDISIYTYRKELVEKLLADGHTVSVMSPYGELIDELKKMGCEFYETPLERHGTNPFQDLKLLRLYKKLLKEIAPDYVFTYTIKPNIYGAMACGKLNIPCIANITGLGTALENPGVVQKITTVLYKIAFSKIQTVFFQNAENRQFFVDRNLYVEKHKLLPGSGVNLERFLPYPLPDGDTVDFVFISRLMKEKGIDHYLDAAKYIKAKYPYTRFHICGFCEAEYEEQMKCLNENDTVIYHGMVKDITTVLKDVHCVVHPTYYPEGLSNVLLEGCASARPIITTDRAGCREVVEDGVNGFVVKQKDSEDLIKQIEKFLALTDDERRQMGLAGRAKVEREFNRNIVINAYLNEIGAEETENIDIMPV